MDHSSKLLFTSIYNVVCVCGGYGGYGVVVTSVDICWIEPESAAEEMYTVEQRGLKRISDDVAGQCARRGS